MGGLRERYARFSGFLLVFRGILANFRIFWCNQPQIFNEWSNQDCTYGILSFCFGWYRSAPLVLGCSPPSMTTSAERSAWV